MNPTQTNNPDRSNAETLRVDRRTALRTAAVGLLAVAFGRGGVGGCAPQAGQRQTFAFLSKADIITLDINQMSYTQDFRVTYAMREGLFVYDYQTGDAVPALAESHEVSPDKKVWTFHLRRDAKWSNGDPVTARDFAFSWRQMLCSPSEYGYLYYYIKNAKAFEQSYLDKQPMPDGELGIAVIDDHTLQVTLDNPLPFLPDLLAFPPFYPRHEPSMRPFRQPDGSYDAAYTRKEHVVLNGAYVLADWEPGKRLLFTKNPHYWDTANVKTATIEMLINRDSQSSMVMYKRGRIDWLVDVPPETAAKLKRINYPDLRVWPAYGTAFLTFNVTERPSVLNGQKNPLSNALVRQALSMATDRQYIVDKITRMGERPALSYVPPGYFEGYQSTMAPGLNPDAARKALADAGYTGANGFPPLSIAYNSDSPVRKALADYLKTAWADVLGIRINLDPLEIKTYRKQVKEKRYTVALVAWYGDYLDLTTWTDKYLSRSLQNDTGWGPAEYDAYCERANSEPDERKRMDLLCAAESMINTQLPILPLYHYVNVMLNPDTVHGLVPNKKNSFQLKQVWVDRSNTSDATTKPATRSSRTV